MGTGGGEAGKAWATSYKCALFRVESRGNSRAVEITYNVILDQDQVQAIYFDLRSDQGQIIFVIFLPIEKIKIKIS